ncbi:4-hydroxy-tetrahydrodipicolinate synthase [Salibacterium halotolerans]|uniref:4-hydroxy-tetrahydrodipicolinate synthase n=1 Tax=Salibacterium halotolerans TaxID=1884432 RepID=A0A1I5MS70_9BACI|nr:4-hydroxy-tetrahydrodipicolinate synthase [Salibacterium halotolerans]SFP12424.1 4-hydroxy-tetrahydrodipicolinate synthase [Salibacterium halotolerans]
MEFGRLLTAMVTPFNREGAIDWPALEPLVEHLLSTGSKGLVTAGTTGESPTLSTEEKLALFRRVKEIAGTRAAVIAGTGTNDTAYSRYLTQKAVSCGVDGIMAVTPYYSKPSQEGMYHHFKTVAEAAPSLPVMIYNIPGRSIVNLEPDTLFRLAGFSNIRSLKEASGDFDQISRVLEHTPDYFQVYSGDDSSTLPLMSIGGTGVVSVASHIAGHGICMMMDQFAEGNTAHAAAWHRTLLPKMKACFMTPSPAPVKGLLEESGVISRYTRAPILPLTEAEMNQLKETFSPA